MTVWVPGHSDREPFVLPDGRTILIKNSFVISPSKPPLGRHGHFMPDAGKVLWSNGVEQRCLLFGGSAKSLDHLRENAAILPEGTARQKAHEEYLEARKYIWSEMIGRVVWVGDSKDPNDIWVIGIEETSTVAFEMMLSKAQG